MSRCPHCGVTLEVGAVSRIQAMVSAYYNIDPIEMRSARRSRNVAWPRQVAMYFAREMTGKSLPNIGRQFDRDHTTVIYALKAVEARLDRDADHRVDVAYLRGKLRG